MDISSSFRLRDITPFDNDNGCIVATLLLDATNSLGEKLPLKVYVKIDLIKRIYEFYAHDPSDYEQEYIEIFRLTLPIYLRELLVGLILSRI